jgi:hypothetical protein
MHAIGTRVRQANASRPAGGPALASPKPGEGGALRAESWAARPLPLHEIHAKTCIRFGKDRRSVRAAFTFFELLAVVAMLAILAGLLLPAFARSRVQARQLHCLANARQIVRGVLLLAAQERPRMLPAPMDFGCLGGKTGAGSALGGHVPAAERPLYPLLPDPAVFACPSDRGDPVLGVDSVFDAVGSSYMYPVRTVDGIQAVGESNVTAFAHPETKVILFEPPLFGDRDVGDPRTRWHDRKRMAVAGFLDGHAQMLESAGYTGDSPDHRYH